MIVRAPNRMPQKLIDDFVAGHEDWVAKKQAQRRDRRAAYSDIEPLTPEEEQHLRRLAGEVIPMKVKLYASLMGVTYGRITIRRQKTRWGSCTRNGNLNFNYLLMLAPEEVMDYVVVHELAHRRQMNHSRAFYAEVEQILPDYRVQERWLKDNGDALFMRAPGEAPDATYYTYMVECADGSLYVGYTNDLDKRVAAHNSGKGAKYTKTRRPVKLVYYEKHSSKTEAMSRESLIKQLTHAKKRKLIEAFGEV